MRDPHSLARGYLTPPALAFWRWSENGRVVTWKDGTTIGFREEIEHVLRRLAPGGLPPFGAVVLLLAACRPGWREVGRDAVGAHAASLSRLGTLDGRFPPPWLDDVLRELDRVHALKLELRTGADAKAVLAETVFDGCEGRGSAEDAAGIVGALEQGLGGGPGDEETISKWLLFRFLQDLTLLRGGVPRVTEEGLDLRRRTGLDSLPAPAPGAAADEPVPGAVRRLLAELRGDRELAGLARLAENLMAAVHVPRRVSDPEELPLGGVSDIVNRGPLDRLLVSELAHDETTLATRVALNEALYLRREQPPRNLPGRRALLLDSGIRMWGTPRVFGAAVALALAATAGRGTEVAAWRATEDGLAPVDLATRAGLAAHLEALEAAPVPAAGLAAFLRRTEPGKEPVDAILVTHEETLADPAFQAALDGLGERTLDVAAVSAEGRYRMVAVTRRGRRPVREAMLSLDDILTPPRPALGPHRGVPLLPAPPDSAFPVVFSVHPFPLLLPHDPDPRRSATHPDGGVVALSRDGRLLHWRHLDRGARQLTDRVPRGTLHFLESDDDLCARAVIGSSRAALHLLIADLREERCTLAHLPATGYPPLGVFRHQDALVLVYSRKLDVFDARSGELLEVHPLPAGTHWAHGRYFRGAAGWSCVAFDGMAARFIEVPLRRLEGGTLFTGHDMLALWDRRGVDGPWGVTAAGKGYSLADGSRLEFRSDLPAPLSVEEISRDGHRVLLRGARGNRRARAILDFASGQGREVSGEGRVELEPQLQKLGRFGVRHRFVAIGASGGQLSLRPRAGPPLGVSVAARGAAVLGLAPCGVRPLIEIPFTPVDSPRGVRWSLRAARWPDGSRAWLDSRGLLHLRSADARVPEIALALGDDGRLGGWSSDGRLCGPKAFTGDADTVPADVFFDAIRRFAAPLA